MTTGNLFIISNDKRIDIITKNFHPTGCYNPNALFYEFIRVLNDYEKFLFFSITGYCNSVVSRNCYNGNENLTCFYTWDIIHSIPNHIIQKFRICLYIV